MDTEKRRKKIDTLGRKVKIQTESGKFWGIRGAIILDEIRSWHSNRLANEKGSALSVLSSTYYAAAGNAKARADLAFGLKPWWLLIAFLCFVRALNHSNRLERLLGIRGMNPDELDVRSHILRKARNHVRALSCIEVALSQEKVSDNSCVLLLLGKAECLAVITKDNQCEAVYAEAWSFIDKVKPMTQIRLMRSLAAWRMRHDKGQSAHLLGRALNLAEEHALRDQALKIRADVKKYHPNVQSLR